MVRPGQDQARDRPDPAHERAAKAFEIMGSRSVKGKLVMVN